MVLGSAGPGKSKAMKTYDQERLVRFLHHHARGPDHELNRKSFLTQCLTKGPGVGVGPTGGVESGAIVIFKVLPPDQPDAVQPMRTHATGIPVPRLGLFSTSAMTDWTHGSGLVRPGDWKN
jgi:hypothetical protein